MCIRDRYLVGIFGQDYIDYMSNVSRKFLAGWEKALQWIDFEYLVNKWQNVVKNDLDKDRLGVFWALLFLSSENKIEMKQKSSLYGPIQIKRIIPDGGLAQLPIENLELEDTSSTAP